MTQKTTSNIKLLKQGKAKFIDELILEVVPNFLGMLLLLENKIVEFVDKHVSTRVL